MSSDALPRAFLSLQGLALGDCFGESFFLPLHQAMGAVAARVLQPAPWPFTDDTLMAVSILNTLGRDSHILPEHLATSFAEFYDPLRGYGPSMNGHLLNLRLCGAQHWQAQSEALFDGHGSLGNGAAMRVAPLGAFFADDLNRLIEQARLSAIATHSHQDAVAGAIAVALAAAASWNNRTVSPPSPHHALTQIAGLTPPGPIRDGLHHAASLSAGISPQQAAFVLGNGSRATATDTVPFALWCAATWPDSYEEALWRTVSALGDRDTTCAIVGGIVILRTSQSNLPREWLARAEPPWHLITL